ncbi:hypothetical protein [Amycolatopsis lexingtonensis]|uniref:hypothetical protein n=1 Tax=Amycolatopsis lexingtonensis TaxID=218822 RepID=UPI003F72C3C9
MSSEGIVATVAAGIALIAMLVAVWQAVEARKSGRVAKRQAEIAESALAETRNQTKLAAEANAQAALAVKAAERAAEAAEAQMSHERSARDELAGPEFELKPRRRRDRVHRVVVRRTTGPEEVWVDAIWSGASKADDTDPQEQRPFPGGLQAGKSGPHYMVRDSTFEIPVVVQNDTIVTVHIALTSREGTENGRTWTKRWSIELKPPPRVYTA